MHLLAFCILWESLLIALCAQFRSLERDDGNISITYIAFIAKKNIRNRSLNRVYTSLSRIIEGAISACVLINCLITNWSSFCRHVTQSKFVSSQASMAKVKWLHFRKAATVVVAKFIFGGQVCFWWPSLSGKWLNLARVGIYMATVVLLETFSKIASNPPFRPQGISVISY